jgi:TolA-binding protein
LAPKIWRAAKAFDATLHVRTHVFLIYGQDAVVMSSSHSVRPAGGASKAAYVPRRQVWQLPIFFVGLLAFVTVCVARPTWREGNVRQLERDLARIRQLLEQRRTDANGLMPVVERLVEQTERHPERAAEIHFLAGAALVRLADRDPAAATMFNAWNRAREHLEEAQILGVAEADVPRLTYLLAKAWAHTNGDVAQIIDALEHSIETGADEPAEGYALLADAYLRLPERNVEAALQANEKELAVHYVGEELLAPARLLRGELLLELKRTVEARKVLANIGNQAPPGVLARARYLRALSSQQEEDWAAAADLWKDALEDRAAPPRDPAMFLFNLGVCCQHLKQFDEAARIWGECMKRGDAGEAGPAAAIELAELRLGEQAPGAALEAFEAAVRDLKEPGDWHNSLVDLNRAREVFEHGCESFRKEGRFEDAIKLARLYLAIATQGAAEAHLGRAAFELAKSLGGGQEALDFYHQAAEAFTKAAELTSLQADQHERLRLAMKCYTEAHEPAKTIALAERLLEFPLEPMCRGKAWYLKAEAHRALGQETSALHAYQECIQYPTDLAFRARFHLAMAEASKKNIDEARSMLDQNVRMLRFETKPDPEALERTLYALAHLLFDVKDYRTAATTFEEAITKFPESPASIRARYDLAECYREMAAEEVKITRSNEHKSAEAIKHHTELSYRYLMLAAEKYQELADVLGKRGPDKPFSKEEEWLYWRAQYDAGGSRRALGQCEEAKTIFEQLSKRYEGRAEQMYALSGIASCYWSMTGQDKAALAAETVESMRALLAKLSDAELDVGPESFDRKTWEGWLQQVTKR